MEEKTIRIDIGRIIIALLKHWYLIGAVGVAAALIMYAYKYDTPQYYTATASVYAAGSGSYSETAQGVQAMQLYSDIITSQKIAERAASIIGDARITPAQIRSMASASSPSSSSSTSLSPVIYISARSTDPTVVIQTANALAKSLVIEAQNMTGTTSVQLLDEAQYISTIGRGVKTKVAYAFIGGVLLTMAIIVLVEILTDRVYRVEDAELDGQIEVIGIIPDQRIN